MLLPCRDRTLLFGMASWPFGIHCKRVRALGRLCEVLVDVFMGRVGCDATSDAGICICEYVYGHPGVDRIWFLKLAFVF